MGKFTNLLGTVLDRFKLGLTGPQLKREGDAVAIRDTADADYADLRAALVAVFGDAIELNAGAAGAGADRVMRVLRPETGMTTDIDVVLPTGTPSPGQLLRVESYANGRVELAYYTASEGASNMVLVDSTTIAFGASSPVALLTKPANTLVERVKVIIDVPFSGAPSLSVGTTGNPAKYAAASHVDLSAAAGTVYDLDYGVDETGASEDIVATYSAGGAAAGIARVQVVYANPS